MENKKMTAGETANTVDLKNIFTLYEMVCAIAPKYAEGLVLGTFTEFDAEDLEVIETYGLKKFVRIVNKKALNMAKRLGMNGVDYLSVR